MLAVKKIGALPGTRVLRISKILETKPQGGPAGQGEFLNAVLKITTALTPFALLRKLNGIEKAMGRKRTVRWGERNIDIDILFYADKVINKKTLKIPHPRIFARDFVVRPLLEIL